MKEISVEEMKIMHSEEYKAYIKALCWVAEDYVSSIRVQFAEKAFEMYSNETVRKIVMAYGEEHEKLEDRRLRDFMHVAEFGAFTKESLNDDCLNNARHYAATIKMLFEIG
jgi:hypothetical protein